MILQGGKGDLALREMNLQELGMNLLLWEMHLPESGNAAAEVEMLPAL